MLDSSSPSLGHLHLLWAKTRQGDGQRHALLHHLLDAGQVALAFWKLVFPRSTRNDFSRALGLDDEAAGRVLATWIGLHDLGKASPAFQSKCPDAVTQLEALGFDFPTARASKAEPHGLVGAWVLSEALQTCGLTKKVASRVARALGGHHGAFPSPLQFGSLHRASNLGGPRWQAARQALLAAMLQVFGAPPPERMPAEDASLNRILALIAGWATAADWVASAAERFWWSGPPPPLGEYADHAKRQAEKAVAELGFSAWHPDGSQLAFQAMFPFPPRLLQQVVIERAARLPRPALAIIEAATGSGKTEAALYLADRWIQQEEGRGLYLAMPTQATSNQMFCRVAEWLVRRYPDTVVNLQLAHGQGLRGCGAEDIVLSSIDEDTPARVAAMEWFLPRKRALLAPFGVGTVDQVFLGVLQARHFFVRLFGLSNKVIVFDEVHAYDTYMCELLWRLLAWLRAIGSSVIILSATLPLATRRQLVQAFGGEVGALAAESSAACLTLVSPQGTNTTVLPEGESLPLRLHHLTPTTEAVVDYLASRLCAGGCAAVVCNSVGHAQAVYKAVRERNLVPADDCLLFHARFPFRWRQAKEQSVLTRFGPNGSRPERAIVVATQVIEQSLDLDFDFMVSELCPIDLLIQRAGRLWRHERTSRPWPERELAVVWPAETQAGEPDFGPSAYVYERYYLLRTMACLQGREDIRLPGDTRALVEAVYDAALPLGNYPKRETIDRARTQMLKAMAASTANARSRLVLPPDDEQFLTAGTLGLAEDEPSLNAALQALTREAPPGITVICLHQLDDGRLVYDPASAEHIAVLAPGASGFDASALLACGLTLQRPDLVAHFARQPVPSGWGEHPALRHCRLVVFEHGANEIRELGLWLHLDEEMGLRVVKEV